MLILPEIYDISLRVSALIHHLKVSRKHVVVLPNISIFPLSIVYQAKYTLPITYKNPS